LAHILAVVRQLDWVGAGLVIAGMTLAVVAVIR